MSVPNITPASLDRDRIKSVVASGQIKEIQAALDNRHFVRKRRKVAEIEESAHEIVIVATTDTVDRDSERVLPISLKKDFGYYKSNPVVLFGHNHSIPAVAKMTDHSFADDQMVMRIKFAVEHYPLAKLLWYLYSDGYMRMSSIGFIPLEWTDDKEQKLNGQQGLTFTRVELIELSLVNVGSNRFALGEELPANIKSDPVLRDSWAWLIESSEARAIEPTETELNNRNPIIEIPGHNENLPLHIHLNVGGGLDENKTTEAKEIPETMADRKHQGAKAKASETSETDEEQQTATPETTEAEDQEQTATSETSESESSEPDDSEATETDDEGADELDDKAIAEVEEKFFGMIGESFEGSYEERQALIYRDLDEYLEFKLGNNEYGYVDFTVLATYDDHVIVRDWEDDETYKATYAFDDDGNIEFTALKRVRIRTTYEEVDDDDEEVMTRSLIGELPAEKTV